MEKALIVARPTLPRQAHTFWEIADAFLAALDREVEAGDKSETTRTTYSVGLRKFVEWIEHQREINPDALLRWVADLRAAGRKPATVNTWLAGVRACFAWAHAQGLIPYNPADSVKGPQRRGTSRAHRREPLTDHEVLRVLDIPPDKPALLRDRALIALMAYTGARGVELQRADLKDLTTQQGRLVLAVRGKGRQETDEVIVIVHPDAERALHDWLAERGEQDGPLFVSFSPRTRGQRIAMSTVRGLVKKHFRAAGVHGRGKTTHSLRHTAITNAVRHGAPVQKVQAMARHANISTTMIYYHETERVEHPAEEYIRYTAGSEEHREPNR